jgi:hypothetical protein
MEFILPSGVVLTSFDTSFVPALGYAEEVGVDKENQYEARRYPPDFFEGRTNPLFGTGASMTTRLKITAPAEFTVNSVGTQVESREDAGRRTVVWQSDQPVHFFNVVAGRWSVKRGNGTAIYYHPDHTYNVEALSAALDAAREHYSQWFYPYPWQELKLSEFASLATYAQGFPTDITFSEGVGFLTNAQASDKVDLAFFVAAHEAAHQWWGNLLLPGKGPGANILAEGMANYSSALLVEQVKGTQARIEFLKQIERLYGEQRKMDEERSMVLTDGSLSTDGTVMYNRGGWVFWMLMNQLGREKMLAGLHAFIEHYRVTDDFPVLQDFLATLRPFAADPEAFDAFARQWVFDKVLPEFQLTDAKKSANGEAWDVTASLTNKGTGSVRVSVAAERGERFDKEGKVKEDFRTEATAIDLGPGESKSVVIQCPFEPDRLVVDPDVQVLQLFRNRAQATL